MTRNDHHTLGAEARRMHLPRRGVVRRRALQGAALFAVLLVLAGLRVVVARIGARADLAEQSAQGQKIFVKTATPVASKTGGALTLPATLRGDIESAIYARVTGYVRSFSIDIGTRVEKGQTLIELDTPELDQQLAQMRAQVELAKANVTLAEAALARWKALVVTRAVSKHEVDEKQNAFATSVAALRAAEANVRQLQETIGFKHVQAPFAGVVTARAVDIGNLVAAGSSGAPLFSIARTDALRVFVDAPQAYAGGVRVGDRATITQAELPGRKFIANIVRIAGAIDVATRSQRIELALPNADGVLTPGAYVQVSLPLPPKGPLSIPTNALLFRAEGPSVAVVDSEGRAHLRPVSIVNDLGATLEIAGGVAADDKVIVNPPDSLAEGEQVSP